MLCEQNTNNTLNTRTKQKYNNHQWIKPTQQKFSGAPSSSLSHTSSVSTSALNNSPGAQSGIKSFKLSDSTEAKSITPENNEDVTNSNMDEDMNERGDAAASEAAAAAADGSENDNGDAAVTVAKGGGSGDEAEAEDKNSDEAGSSSSSDEEDKSSNGEEKKGDEEDVEMGEADDGDSDAKEDKSGASPQNKDDPMDESGDNDEGEGDSSEAKETKNDSGENKSESKSSDDMEVDSEEKAEAEKGGGEGDKDKTNGNGEAKKSSSDDTTKKDEEAKKPEDDEKKPPDEKANLPLLVGTLAYSDRDNLRRHIIRGNWKYEHSHAIPPQRFELIRTIPPEEELKELPKDGEFHGSFNVQHQVKTSKGKLKMKNRAVPESGVKLTFKAIEGNEEEDEVEGKFSVNGTGTNEYGVFELFGTATKNTEVEGDPTYSVSMHKKYVAPPPAPPAGEGGAAAGSKKDKKRKLADASEDEVKPPPTELPKEGIFLRGKLARNTSDELSLDNTAVHRITGLWTMGTMSKILDEPETCEKFEFEHKCSGDSTVFPLSGRYTGFIYVSEAAGQRTKVQERDVTLKFRLNNEGYHNVEGRGSNPYGKYSITGTLDKDGTISLARHYGAIKLKATKKAHVKISAPANGSSTKAPPKAGGVASSTVDPASSSLLTFDDVNLPDESDGPPPQLDPPEQFTAISRGILKMEDDGTHTCSGSWAMTNEHFQSGITSKYHFGIPAHHAADDAKQMLDRMKASGQDKDDDREINKTSDGVSPVTLANSTFPIDSTQYKGSFKIRKGATRTATVVDNQIVLMFVKNSGGSYNVYGKGSNEMGTFDLIGTLILQGKTNGLMQLYRMYPQVAAAPVAPAQASRKSSKVFQGGLTEKADNSGPVPAMKPPERFVPSMSGLQRRESSRMSRLPSRLEEDDPQATMDRLMEKCRNILKELQEADVQHIFAVPVDPIALGIPTYFDVITEPMDLGTIKTKLDNNNIDSPDEFKRLVTLTFQNAITFNTMPDNIVNVTARTLLGLFNKKFGTTDVAYNAAKKNRKLTKAERAEEKRKEKEKAKEEKRKAKAEKDRKRKAEVEASNESKRMKLENILAANKSTMAAIASAAPSDPNAEVSRTEYNLLLQAIKQVQEQIVGLHKLVKKSSKSTSAASSSTGNKVVASDASSMYTSSYVAETSEPPKPKKKKQKKEPEYKPSPPPSPVAAPAPAPVVEDLQPLSFEEQEALSEAINLLPERLLPGAMQIIREADFVNDDDDEIDLDIDQLDTKTQRKLQSFVMENVKTKKKKKQSKKPAKAATPAPAPAAPPSPAPSPPPEEEPPKPAARQPGGKSFFALGDDDDSDDDKDEDEEEDLQADFATNWVANPTTEAAAEEKDAGENSDKDEDDEGLWGAARKEAEAAKEREADKARREEKMRAEADKAAQERMAEAAALGEQARAKREEEAAAEALLREQQEKEAEEAKNAAREKALAEVEGVKATVDLGDAQRALMEQYENEFNDNYSAGASPSSDFGF